MLFHPHLKQPQMQTKIDGCHTKIFMINALCWSTPVVIVEWIWEFFKQLFNICYK